MTLPVTAMFGAPEPGTSPAAAVSSAGSTGDLMFTHMLEAALGSAPTGATPAPGAPQTGGDRRPGAPTAAPTPTFPGRTPRIVRDAGGTGEPTQIPVVAPDAPAIVLPLRPQAPADDTRPPADRAATDASDGDQSLATPAIGPEPTRGDMHALPMPWPALLPNDAALGAVTSPAAPGGDDIAFINGAVRSAIERMELSSAGRGAGAIVPELRTRLDRLIDRMWSEFGYRVEVVETTRTQARQDELFARGRSIPGTLVTWTRASAHTAGRAADVRIDGGWTNTAAFEQLSRVAREEGLRTLGPRDPGHIELPLNAARQPDGIPRSSSESIVTAAAAAEAPVSLAPRLSALRVGIREAVPPPRDPRTPSLPDRLPSAALPVHSLPVPREGEGRPRALPMEPIGLPGGRRPDPPASGPVALPMPVERRTEPSVRPMPSRSADPHTVSPVAPVATVAAVAQPAAVATVASVAQPTGDTLALPATGAPPLRTRRVAPAAPATAEASSRARHEAAAPTTMAPDLESDIASLRLGAASYRPATQHPAEDRGTLEPQRSMARGVATAAGRGEHGDRETGREQPGTSPLAQRAAVMDESLFPTLARDAAVAPASGGSEVLHTTGSDAAERIARLTDTRDAVRERPLSSVLLRLEAPDGGEDRVRVDLRGASVGAAFDMRDSGTVDRLSAHLNELAQAFERQGLDPESITVRTLRAGEGLSAPLRSAAERELAPGRMDTGHEGRGREGDARGGQPRPDDSRNPDGRQRDRRGRHGGHSA